MSNSTSASSNEESATYNRLLEPFGTRSSRLKKSTATTSSSADNEPKLKFLPKIMQNNETSSNYGQHTPEPSNVNPDDDDDSSDMPTPTQDEHSQSPLISRTQDIKDTKNQKSKRDTIESMPSTSRASYFDSKDSKVSLSDIFLLL